MISRNGIIKTNKLSIGQGKPISIKQIHAALITSKNDSIAIKRIAAIDLGTNSFHAVIVDIFSDGSFRRIDDLKEMVELAKGGLGNGLSDEAFDRGIEALKKIKVLCDSYEVERILAYATSAIREAANGGQFIQAAIDHAGIKINAIPGKTEAELIGYAVQHGVHLTSDPVLIVDIGGGSVEFILANDKEFFFTISKKLGVSRMRDVFQPKDPITPKDIETLTAHYEKELAEITQSIANLKVETVIGSSGTMQTIGTMIAKRKDQSVDVTLNELTFSAEDYFEFYEEFIALDEEARANYPGMDTRRLRFINTGVVLVKLILEKYGIRQVKISTQALREGIIIRYLKREMIGLPWSGEFADPRKRSVFELLRKCNWHEEHSKQVARLALVLFDALQTSLDLQTEDRELLELAAYMHDIGYHISHSAHHKHALYLIKHADLKGFRQDEIEVMAHVARYHRRSTPKKRHTEFWKLDKKVKDRIKKLAGIIRVADGLDRSHYQNVQELEVEITRKKLILHIKTQDEPNLEIWGATRKAHLLEEVSGKKVAIKNGSIKN